MTTNKPEVVAYATHHDEPMLFPSKREASLYCDAGEEPLALIRVSDYESLQAECEKLRGEVAGLHAALAAQLAQEPVGFVSQDFLDGKWSLDHIAKTDTGQISRVIPVFTRAQLEAVLEPIKTSYTDGVGACRRSPQDCRYGISYVTVADTVYWPLSADDAQRLRSAECGGGDFTGPANECPDVSGLVEALTELCDEIDKHEIHAAISKTSISWFKRKARKALAAHRKQGDSNG